MIVIPSKEKLKSLSNDKLIDAVKNYRQYGYEVATRDLCLSILYERGYNNELLRNPEISATITINRLKIFSIHLIKIKTCNFNVGNIYNYLHTINTIYFNYC